MKKMLAGMLVLGLAAGLYAGEGHKHGDKAEKGSDKKPATATVKGEVLDLNCYFGHEAKGKDHIKCAQKCLSEGAPAGLLTEDGQVYLLLENHADPKPFEAVVENAGKTVTVTGKLLKKGGLQAIQVASIKA